MGDSPQSDPLGAILGLLIIGALLYAGYATISSLFGNETPAENPPTVQENTG